MRVDIREKVRERMVSSEDTTLVINARLTAKCESLQGIGKTPWCF
jgi:hypothetical protein